MSRRVLAAACAATELNRLVAQAKTAAAAPAKGPNVVDVGRAPAGRRFTINAFFPSRISVRAGSAVTFTMAGQNTTEVHTITVGAVSRQQVPFVTSTGVINPVAAYPSDPPNAFPPWLGVNHGNGFLNAGLHDNDPATTTIPNTGRSSSPRSGRSS